MTLHEMSKQASELLALLEADEIDEQTFSDTIEAMGAIDKVESCCQVLSELAADEAKFSLEIERLQRAKKSIKSNMEWLKKQIHNFYVANGSQKIKTEHYTVTARKSKYVEIADDYYIPPEYMKINPTPDKTALKKALESGEEFKGVTLKERESVLIR